MSYWHTDPETGEEYFDWSHLYPVGFVLIALLIHLLLNRSGG